MFVSVTELHLKGVLSFIRFIPHAIKSKMQADQADGVKSVQVSSQGLLIQRTLTVWESKDHMLKYMRSGAHIDAMKIFSKIATDSFSYNFESESLPTWENALELLKQHGKRISPHAK